MDEVTKKGLHHAREHIERNPEAWEIELWQDHGPVWQYLDDSLLGSANHYHTLPHTTTHYHTLPHTKQIMKISLPKENRTFSRYISSTFVTDPQKRL